MPAHSSTKKSNPKIGDEHLAMSLFDKESRHQSNECSNYSQDEVEDEISFEGNEDSSPNKQEVKIAESNEVAIESKSSPTKVPQEEKKEVTYSAYGINLENTCKLLTCSK